jgi:sortase (surface protein transpeptidase)
MSERKQGHRRPTTLSLMALLLAVAGAALLTVAVRAQRHPPQPPPQIAGSYALGGETPTGQPHSAPTSVRTDAGRVSRTAAPAATPTTSLVLPAAAPTRLRIPAIGVDSSLVQLGLNADGSVQVPPLSRDSRAGWYQYSPAPGQLGPAIILGHIDSAAYGPGVFFRLGALRPGDTVSISRVDHSIAVFHVDAVAEYPKAHFPTLTVYGNTSRPTLRLITCGGRFDFTAHSYEDNIVAYATLTAATRA